MLRNSVNSNGPLSTINSCLIKLFLILPRDLILISNVQSDFRTITKFLKQKTFLIDSELILFPKVSKLSSFTINPPSNTLDYDVNYNFALNQHKKTFYRASVVLITISRSGRARRSFIRSLIHRIFLRRDFKSFSLIAGKSQICHDLYI